MLLEKKVWLREWQEVFGEEGVAGDSLEVFGEEGMAEGDVTEEEGVTEGVAGEAWRCYWRRGWNWEVFNCCIYYICMYVGSNIYHS